MLRTASKRPLLAIEVPHNRVDDVRVLRVHVEVGAPVPVVDKERPAPRRPPVARDEHAALRVRPPDMPHGAGEDGAHVGRAHHHPGDVPRITEPEETPAPAAVGRLVHPAAEGDRIARVRLAGAGVDHVGVSGLQGEIADGKRRLLLEERGPGGAAIDGFPDAAGRRSHIDGVRVAWHAFDVGRASHHVGGADGAEVEAGEGGGVDGGAGGGGRGALRDEIGGQLKGAE